MNAYRAYDAIEKKSWDAHFQQLAREEREVELADGLEKGLSLRLLESLCLDELPRRGASKKAISRMFDDNTDFQERAAEFLRYMAETCASHQIDIDSED